MASKTKTEAAAKLSYPTFRFDLNHWNSVDPQSFSTKNSPSKVWVKSFDISDAFEDHLSVLSGKRGKPMFHQANMSKKKSCELGTNFGTWLRTSRNRVGFSLLWSSKFCPIFIWLIDSYNKNKNEQPFYTVSLDRLQPKEGPVWPVWSLFHTVSLFPLQVQTAFLWTRRFTAAHVDRTEALVTSVQSPFTI